MQAIYRYRFFPLITLLVAGGISVFAFAPFRHGFVISLSIILLFWVMDSFDKNLSKWKLFGYGYVYGMAYFNSQGYWIYPSLYKIMGAGVGVSMLAQLGITGFVSIYIALSVFCYTRSKTRHRVFNVAFLYPSYWVLFEWLRGWFLGGVPWCDVGYSQVNNVFFKGLYPILGNYAVSWIIVSLSGVVYLLLNHKTIPLTRSQLRGIVIYAVTIFMLGLGTQNIVYTTPYGRPLKVSMLQGNIAEVAKWSTNENLNVYTTLVKEAQGDLILVPETAIAQFERDLPKGYINNLTQIALEKRAALLVGMPKVIDNHDNYVNAAVLLTSSPHLFYAKYHLVPYGEYIPIKWLFGPLYKLVSLPMVNFSPGAEYQTPIVAANQKLAVNICYENGFSGEILEAASNSTLMVNLSDMVWYGMTIAEDEHLQISQARALENQRYFLQDTNTGLTAVIKPDGEIQSKLPSFKRAILTDYVEGRVGTTPFERFGNYLIIIFVSLIILFGLIYIWITKHSKS